MKIFWWSTIYERVIWNIRQIDNVDQNFYLHFGPNKSRISSKDLCLIYSPFPFFSHWQFIYQICLCKYMLLHFLWKKICKQNWKEIDSWVYNKTIRFFNSRQRQASIDQEKDCFNFYVHLSNVHLPWIMVDFKFVFLVPHI